MSEQRVIQKFAARYIGWACRRLPEGMRDERLEEWTAELSAVLADPAGGRAFRRATHGASYALGISRASRRLRRLSGIRDRHPRRVRGVAWQNGALPASPGAPAFRAVVGVGSCLVVVMVVVALVRGLQPHGPWPILAGMLAAIGFVGFCLVDLARAAEVRYLPKWAWALACLLSVPLGGIMYLSVGRPHRTLRHRLPH